MIKKFNKFEIATIKSTAKLVNPLVSKKLKILEQIKNLNEEFKALDEEIERYQEPIKVMTGGYSTEDLIERVVETSDALDKNGKAIKVAKYVLRYPDTVIPVIAEEMENEIKEESPSQEIAPEVEEENSDANPYEGESFVGTTKNDASYGLR